MLREEKVEEREEGEKSVSSTIGDGIHKAAQGGEHCTERVPAACIGFRSSKIVTVSGQG